MSEFKNTFYDKSNKVLNVFLSASVIHVSVPIVNFRRIQAKEFESYVCAVIEFYF